jgi:CHAT domain-containing protein/Tfp pilus assembly protein PilF
MRILPWLTLVLLTGCESHMDSLEMESRSTQDLLRTERYDLALPKAEDGLRRAERSGDLNFEWRFRLLKAEILLGRRLAAQALTLLDSYGDPPSGLQWAEIGGRALLLRGQASYLLNRFPESRDLLARAAVSARQSGSASLAAWVELRRGMLLVGQSRFDEAEDAFRHVIDSASQLHEAYLAASATQDLGLALLSESRCDEAIRWSEQASLLFSRLGAADSVARANGNLGTCYLRLGDYDNARLRYEKAQADFAKTGNRFEQQAWEGNAAAASFDNGDYAAAAAGFKHALEIARQLHSSPWIGRWLRDLASTSIELGEWDAAERYNNEARALTGGGESSSLLYSAQISAGRKRFAEAEGFFRAALNQPGEDPNVPLIAHTGLADIYVHQGSPQKAEAEFQATLAVIDERGASLLKDDYKISYLARLMWFYGRYIDFLMANNQPRRALEVAESSRSRVLAERSGRPEPAERQEAHYRRLARQADATLLEYWIGTRQSYLWVVTPQEIRCHILPAKGVLDPLIQSYRAVIMAHRNPLDVAGDTGRKLYDALLAPAFNDAPNDSRFVIVPDGDLQAVNFETLPDGGNAGKFWIERATISIAPSLNYLTRSHRRSSQKAGLLLIGDPAPSVAEYPRLEFAAQEMNSIAAAMGGSPQTVLKGAAAQPAAYANAGPARFGYIHFSAHAVANQVNPLDSAVMLSGPSEKCRLLARDVMAIPLTADLVTISACRSAGGKTYAGEGLVGFAWAFLRAGAANVVAGLWDVNDRSTAQLMSGFYARIAAGTPVPDALRAAKLALIRDGGAYAKPFYWAPFQVYTGACR